MKFRVAALLTSLPVFFACTATIKDPAIRRKAANIEILTQNQIAERKYTIIREVKGVDCQPTFRDTDVERARESLKVDAARSDADAIISVACEPVGYGFSCGHSVECRGDAIKWQP